MFLIVLSSCAKIGQDDLSSWRKDRYGCEGHRDQEMLERILKDVDLNAIYQSDLNRLLGRPDTVIYDAEFMFHKYYFSGRCKAGKIVDSIDHCFAQFRFDHFKKQIVDHKTVCW